MMMANTRAWLAPREKKWLLVSFFVKSYCFTTANIKILTAYSKHRQAAQLSLTDQRNALHHDKRQNFKTVT